MPIQQQETALILRLLTVVNQLHLKAFEAKNKQALNFLILNDTVQAIRYDRAVLWRFEKDKTHILGISGQTSITASSELIKNWKALIESLSTPQKSQGLEEESFLREKDLWASFSMQSNTKPSAVWIPFVYEGQVILGLWLERWDKGKWQPGEINILNNLMKAYGYAWLKFDATSQSRYRKIGQVS